MDNFVYQILGKYFHTLSITGYIKQPDVNKLLVLLFYYHLLYHDYRGYVSEEDYACIEKALNCLYGTTCLIPYPDYLKMGKLKLGEITELAQRIKNIEESDVVKVFHNMGTLDGMPLSDISIVETPETDELATDEERIQDNIRRLNEHDSHFETVDNELAEHDSRITTIERTPVVKGNGTTQVIPDINTGTS